MTTFRFSYFDQIIRNVLRWPFLGRAERTRFYTLSFLACLTTFLATMNTYVNCVIFRKAPIPHFIHTVLSDIS